MAVKLRLKRIGRRNRPFFRICVFDSRTRRDGAPIEELGAYDPYAETLEDKVTLNGERVLYWLGVGAQPSETVGSFLRRLGVRKGQPLPEGFMAKAAEAAATELAADADAGADAGAEATADAPADAVPAAGDGSETGSAT